jgi:hypothetical protein
VVACRQQLVKLLVAAVPLVAVVNTDSLLLLLSVVQLVAVCWRRRRHLPLVVVARRRFRWCRLLVFPARLQFLVVPVADLFVGLFVVVAVLLASVFLLLLVAGGVLFRTAGLFVC